MVLKRQAWLRHCWAGTRRVVMRQRMRRMPPSSGEQPRRMRPAQQRRAAAQMSRLCRQKAQEERLRHRLLACWRVCRWVDGPALSLLHAGCRRLMLSVLHAWVAAGRGGRR